MMHHSKSPANEHIHISMVLTGFRIFLSDIVYGGPLLNSLNEIQDITLLNI